MSGPSIRRQRLCPTRACQHPHGARGGGWDSSKLCRSRWGGAQTSGRGSVIAPKVEPPIARAGWTLQKQTPRQLKIPGANNRMICAGGWRSRDTTPRPYGRTIYYNKPGLFLIPFPPKVRVAEGNLLEPGGGDERTARSSARRAAIGLCGPRTSGVVNLGVGMGPKGSPARPRPTKTIPRNLMTLTPPEPPGNYLGPVSRPEAFQISGAGRPTRQAVHRHGVSCNFDFYGTPDRPSMAAFSRWARQQQFRQGLGPTSTVIAGLARGLGRVGRAGFPNQKINITSQNHRKVVFSCDNASRRATIDGSRWSEGKLLEFEARRVQEKISSTRGCPKHESTRTRTFLFLVGTIQNAPQKTNVLYSHM